MRANPLAEWQSSTDRVQRLGGSIYTKNARTLKRAHTRTCTPTRTHTATDQSNDAHSSRTQVPVDIDTAIVYNSVCKHSHYGWRFAAFRDRCVCTTHNHNRVCAWCVITLAVCVCMCNRTNTTRLPQRETRSLQIDCTRAHRRSHDSKTNTQKTAQHIRGTHTHIVCVVLSFDKHTHTTNAHANAARVAIWHRVGGEDRRLRRQRNTA